MIGPDISVQWKVNPKDIGQVQTPICYTDGQQRGRARNGRIYLYDYEGLGEW